MVSDFERREIEHRRRMDSNDRQFILGLIVFFGMCSTGVGILGYFANKGRNIESCIQLATQQRFSPDLCSDTCFRDSYLELQRKYKVDDLDLAYRITTNRCGKN